MLDALHQSRAIPTKEQLADILTKVVDFSTFVSACNILFKGRNALKL